MADHSLPTLTSLYADFLNAFKNRIDDNCKMLDPEVVTATNVPTNSIRWSSANSRLEKFNGTAWNALSASYSMRVTLAQDLIGGNSTTLLGAIPYQSNTDSTTFLSPNITTTRKFLRQIGTGTNGAAPVWDVVTATDVGLSNVTNESKSTMFTSPTFTGTPTAPTPTAEDNSTKIATTAFVQGVVSGYLIKSGLTGETVTLTNIEANNAIFSFSGALTSNLIVVVPSIFPRVFTVLNRTTGAFTLTLKTASGASVAVAQGKRNMVFVNSAGCYDAFNDFESITLTGTSVAPTATAGTNTTQIATTAFVQAHDDTAKANLASPAFTGTPTAPTPTAGDNSTKIATTAFVLANADTVTSANVGAANAGLAAGAVGTYAFLSKMTSAGSIAVGETEAGTNLKYTGISIYSTTAGYPIQGGQGADVLGTWKAMGYCQASGTAGYYPSTVWLRIA